MNKEQFLKSIATSLNRLSDDEREDILEDFQEHFEIGKAEGKTEEEISKSLGSPNQIAKELLASYYLEKVDGVSTTGNILRAIWAETFEFFDLFFSITLTGLGLLIVIGMLSVTRFVSNGFVRYLNYNVKLVKGGLKHE